MDHVRATVDNNGQLVLPAAVQRSLGLASGTEVEVVLHDRYIELREPLPPLSQEELDSSIAAMQALFAGQPSLEDDLYAMRREEEGHQKRKYGW